MHGTCAASAYAIFSVHSDAELHGNEEECRRAFVANPASMVDRQDLLLDVYNPSVMQSFVYQVRSSKLAAAGRTAPAYVCFASCLRCHALMPGAVQCAAC
jgi:hypothetical protein